MGEQIPLKAVKGNIDIIESMFSAHPVECAGTEWYEEVGAWIRVRAKEMGVTAEQYANVVSAMSPRTRWDQNIRASEAVIEIHLSGKTGEEAELAYRALGLPAFPANAVKSFKYLDTGDIRWGAKTRNFALNLMGDPDSVTLDAHILAIAMGQWWSGRVFAASSDKVYNMIADALRRAAKARGMSPHALQAGMWVTRRRMLNGEARGELGVTDGGV